MAIDTTYRTEATEIMDDFSLAGVELQDALDKIARINQLLGGNRLTLNGIKKLLDISDTTQTITIADIGCGNGDMLRMLADYAIQKNIVLQLIGIDANAFTVAYAQKLSAAYPNILYSCVDIFSPAFENVTYDIVLCTLTLHHFKEDEIVNIISTFSKNATTGILINDLHRSLVAYRLFEFICWIFRLNRMSREDGLVSILRGFKKKELEDFSKKLNVNRYSIRWKWAFRYQWIIYKR